MGWAGTRLTGLLGIRYPLIQAPMAGGATTPELVAAVSEAGALGSLGASAMAPDGIRDAIRRIRELTGRPFAVNLFAPHERPEPDPEIVAGVDAVLEPYRLGLGLETPTRSGRIAPPDPFEAQLAVVVEERVPVFSFTFGLAPIEAAREAGAVTLGTATTAVEAVALAEHGVDAVVAQGSEAGGHRGTFAVAFEDALVGALALVPQVVDAVDLPVVAAGGIADGRGIAAVLALGADGAQLGTAFVACAESGVPESYKRAVLSAADTDTVVTRAYTGRHARMIRTPLIEELERTVPAGYPAQAALVADLRQAGIELDRPDLLLLLAGQAAGLSRRLPAGQLVEALAAETEDALARLGD